MQITLPHEGTQADGIAHVKKLLEENRAKIEENVSNLKAEWQNEVLSFSFDTQGSHIEGTLTVLDKQYDLYAKLPLALRLFEGTIERMIATEAKKMEL
ncbi:MAG: polyhydroxyalkanoic acid system family protein [Candidatus Kaiserbacteria bacterium]|nr:polyhydroxyalkanoic acid system family protein [Candidatus Kaiserbacteria bacterium]